jgi:hypothetical protein
MITKKLISDSTKINCINIRIRILEKELLKNIKKRIERIKSLKNCYIAFS